MLGDKFRIDVNQVNARPIVAVLKARRGHLTFSLPRDKCVALVFLSGRHAFRDDKCIDPFFIFESNEIDHLTDLRNSSSSIFSLSLEPVFTFLVPSLCCLCPRFHAESERAFGAASRGSSTSRVSWAAFRASGPGNTTKQSSFFWDEGDSGRRVTTVKAREG